MDWFKKVVFENYANFSGRARRKEYWMFMLFYFIFSFILSLIIGLASIFFTPNVALIIDGGLNIIWTLIFFIPLLAVTIRRFHDFGKSGWWLLAQLLASVIAGVSIAVLLTTSSPNIKGVLAILAFMSICFALWTYSFLFRDSQSGVNQWGPNPKDEGEYREMPPAL